MDILMMFPGLHQCYHNTGFTLSSQDLSCKYLFRVITPKFITGSLRERCSKSRDHGKSDFFNFWFWNLFMMHRVFRWLKNKGNINFGWTENGTSFWLFCEGRQHRGASKAVNSGVHSFCILGNEMKSEKQSFKDFLFNEWRQNPGFIVTKSL